MKQLYAQDDVAIGILDDNNYVTFRLSSAKVEKAKGGKTLTRYACSYHGQINHAIKEAARLLANEQAQDLAEWLKVYCGCLQEADRMLNDARAHIQKARKATCSPCRCSEGEV